MGRRAKLKTVRREMRAAIRNDSDDARAATAAKQAIEVGWLRMEDAVKLLRKRHAP